MKMKEFLVRAVIIFVALIIAVFIGSEFLRMTLNRHADTQRILNEEAATITNYQAEGTMIGHGVDNMRVIPISAYIENGNLYVKATLKNETGMDLKLDDYGVVSGNASSTVFSTNYENGTVIKNNTEKEAIFRFGAYNLMYSAKNYPNTLIFDLGTRNAANNNYIKYDLKFTIAWIGYNTEW